MYHDRFNTEHLHAIAKAQEIEGRGSMTRDELIDAITFPRSPETREDLDEYEEVYRQLIEWRNNHPHKRGEGYLGTKNVLFPSEDTPPELIRAFHDLMTERGPFGVEYAQEALHSEGGDYFKRMFDNAKEVFEDFGMFENAV